MFSKGAKVFLSFLITVAVASAISLTLLVSDSYAQSKDVQMNCNKFNITWHVNEYNYPVVMTFSNEKGVWQEVPSGFKDRMFFYKLEDGKAAKMDIVYGNSIRLQIYKNTRDLNHNRALEAYTCKVIN